MTKSLVLLVLIVAAVVVEEGAFSFALVLPLILSLVGRVSKAEFLTWSFAAGLIMDLVGLGRLGLTALAYSLFALGLLLIRKFLPGKNMSATVVAVVVLIWIDSFVANRGGGLGILMASTAFYFLFVLVGRRFTRSNFPGKPLILRQR